MRAFTCKETIETQCPLCGIASWQEVTLAKQFDVSTKYLLELGPKDWLDYAGLPSHEARVVNANLETVIAEADKVLEVNAGVRYIAHFELQASLDTDMPMRLLKYNVLLRDRFNLPVQSVLVLLREASDSAVMSGDLSLPDEYGREAIHFRYRVVRAWKQPVSSVLSGGVYALPLAIISDLSGTTAEAVVRRMDERITHEVSPTLSGDLWTTTFLLMGLRYNESETIELLKGITSMQESVTYQAIVAKGRAEGKAEGKAEEAQKALLIVGAQRLGEPDVQARRGIEALHNIDKLEMLLSKVLSVESWDELLS